MVDPGLRLAAGDVEFVEFAVQDADNAVAYAKRDFGTAMWKVPADILAAPKRRRLSERRKLIIVDDFLPQHVSLAATGDLLLKT